MRKSGIYCIKNLTNNKLYIGSARNLSNRKYGHFRTLLHNKHRNPYLQKSYNKYGVDNFKFIVLKVVKSNISEKSLQNIEDKYIKKYNSFAHHNGYNLLSAFRKIVTPYHRQLMINANKKSQLVCNKKVYQYGQDGSFIREYQSVNRATQYLFPGIPYKQITVDRKSAPISYACSGKRNGAFGYLWSFIKHKSVPKKSLRPWSRKVYQVSKETNKLINKFNSITEASGSTGVSVSNIVSCIRKYKYRNSAGGFIWRYV